MLRDLFIKMRLINKNKGQSLIEAIFVIGLFIVLISGVTMLMFRYLKTQQRATELSTASIVSEESFNALEAIARSNWATLVSGNHGLAFASNQWAFSGSNDL